ncbi:MAG TPA: metallophosphoesterase [Vicinamibacterales bacterium]
MHRLLLAAGIAVALVRAVSVGQEATPLPNRPGSLKFAAIGDNGTGDQPQYDVARQMEQWHQRFSFDMVIMLGDNLYGSQQPGDFVRKFERPYKPLLDAGVKFYASLGNHDNRSNDAYPPFNMHGERYYTYVRNDVRFVVLDSNALDPPQLAWVERTLQAANERWKIAYFHHPLYSDGGRHGSEVDLRVKLEPLFVK